MRLYQIIKLLSRNRLPLVIVPAVLTASVIWFTRNETKLYESRAMIYTGLASGYDIETKGNERFDNYAANNAFDNFLNIAQSRKTLEQVGLKLLTKHLIAQRANKQPMNRADWKVFNEAFPPEKTKELFSSANEDSIIETLRDSLQSPTGIFYKKLLQTSRSFYSLRSLDQIAVKRMGAGDMIEIAYQTHDSHVCQQTLIIYLETILERYKDLKQSETGSVVAYFEEQLSLAYEKLSAAEKEIKEFREANRIINYQEQTRYIAEKQEDAEDDYHKEVMAQRAAESARDELARKLKMTEKLVVKNDDVLVLKEELSTLNTKITLLEISDPNNPAVADMQKRANELSQQVKNEVAELYDLSHSIEGVPVSVMLNQWLDHMIEADKATARVAQFTVKMDDLEKKYDRFAPLGSQLSRLERKVEVAEREYLQILHGLNQAKIKEKSVSMKSNLTVVDTPSLPIDHLPSKRKLLVIASFLCGVILVLSVAVIGEYLNTGIRSAENAEARTGLKVIGAIPNLNDKKVKDYPEISTRAANFILNGIEGSAAKNGIRNISLISSNKGEGKSRIIGLLQAHQENLQLKDTPIFNECPAQRSGLFSMDTLKESNLVIWVIKAHQSWGPAEERLLDQLQSSGLQNVQILINGISTFWLDSLIGELPAKRTTLRKFIKQIAQFQFSKQNVFAS